MPHAQHGSASATIQLASVSEYFAKCNGEPVRAEASLRFVCVTPPHVRGVGQRAEFASSKWPRMQFGYRMERRLSGELSPCGLNGLESIRRAAALIFWIKYTCDGYPFPALDGGPDCCRSVPAVL